MRAGGDVKGGRRAAYGSGTYGSGTYGSGTYGSGTYDSDTYDSDTYGMCYEAGQDCYYDYDCCSFYCSFNGKCM
ncbi:MAG: hypothetical protein JNL82_24465 [Myxococcales bacterium]|nr:hypothetical protein [Myxococcales bacterium]